jgi:hypothetical protein
MTLYLNFRSQNVGGAVVEPRVFRGDPAAVPLALQPITSSELTALVRGKNVLFAVHGFNVSLEYGARSLGRLESQLSLTAAEVFVAVLWPGDYWIPVVNYPFEGSDAIDCGKRLAEFCASSLGAAQSLSFISHSLGARVVLEALKNLPQPARVACLAAAAINQDCLTAQYSPAAENCSKIAVLASHSDRTLKYAFPIGDPIADLLHDDHALFESALGYDGPALPAPPQVAAPWQIPDGKGPGQGYDHGDYLPRGEAQPAAGSSDAKWKRVAQFVSKAFRGQPQDWPS